MEKLSAPIFDSRIKSDTVTNAEKWLGYLLGPAGALLLLASVLEPHAVVFLALEVVYSPHAVAA